MKKRRPTKRLTRKARETVDKFNAADSLVFQTEKQLKEFGDKLPADKKAPIEAALTELKEAHKSQDIDRLDKATEQLNTAWQAASEELYKAGQEKSQGTDPNANAGQSANSNSKAGSEEVTDVDFEEVK